jgi:RimJ/RimL family protein N-acetyltransferase
MAAAWTVRRLRPEDAPALVALRREALAAHPLAFAASPEDDHALSPEFARVALADRDDQTVFGLFQGADLAGMAGLIRESRLKLRHKATIWGVYVTPRVRGTGQGRALVEAAIAHARRWPGVTQVQLTVSDTSLGARRLYEALGFRTWGREPRAFRWEGRFIDDHHMVLDLDAVRTEGAMSDVTVDEVRNRARAAGLTLREDRLEMVRRLLADALAPVRGTDARAIQAVEPAVSFDAAAGADDEPR